MKFMMLQKDTPEYVSNLREYLGREYDLGATMKEIRHGSIINKDGSVANKAIMVCFKGSLLSYLRFKNTYGKVTTVISGWPNYYTCKQ